jgi:hypothetical protein
MKKDKKTTGKTPRKTALEKKYELVIEKFKGKKPISYKMSGLFKKDDLIGHTTFGKGLVLDAYSKKIDVLFSDQIRTLVCERED